MSVDLPPGLYRLKGGNIASGTMRVLGPKKCILEKGSEARGNETPRCPERIRNARQEMLKAGVFVQNGQRMHLIEDYEVRSSSQAEGILMGRPPLGNKVWERIPDDTSSPPISSDAVPVSTILTETGAHDGNVDESTSAATSDFELAMEDFIDSTVTTFMRERHRYIDLVELVRTKMSELTQNMVVAIQYRVKDPDSLKKKLAKYATGTDGSVASSSELRQHFLNVVGPALAGERVGTLARRQGEPWRSLQEATLDLIPDLAGVRVLFYREADMKYLVDRIVGDRHTPAFPSSSDVAEDLPDALFSEVARRKTLGEFKKETENRYQAHHEGLIYRTHADAAHDGLDYARCEIQITTVAKHLTNEVGHEVDYKRLTGNDERKAINDFLRTIQRFMEPVQETLEELFNTAGIPTAEDAAKLLKQGDGQLDEFWDSGSISTRAEELRSEEVRKWLTLLANYATSGSDEESREALSILTSNENLDKKWKELDLSESVVAVAHNEGIEERQRQLDPELAADAALIRILSTLPRGFLKDFAEDKGVRKKGRGRPRLIVNIADAFLASQERGASVPKP